MTRWGNVAVSVIMCMLLPCCRRHSTRLLLATVTRPLQLGKKRHITIWLYGTDLYRFIPWSKRPAPRNDLQLTPVQDRPIGSHVRIIARALAKHGPDLFAMEDFYLFNWSGRLSHAERERAGEKLYEAIQQLLRAYKGILAYNTTLTIIAFSHGGNVALNMVNVMKKEKECPFHVDRLILLACPVQDRTSQLVQSPFFRRVYSFYSANDLIQIIPLQGYRKISKRCFHPHPTISQVRVRWKYRGMKHHEFREIAFMKHLPAILQAVDEHTRAKKGGDILGNDYKLTLEP